jgi:hypothetical protein
MASFFSCKFFLIFGHQSPGSGSVPIQPKMLDPDPDEIKADPQPWEMQYKKNHRRFGVTV